MHEEKRYNYLMQRFNEGTATGDELAELERLLSDPETKDRLQELWKNIASDASFFETAKSEAILAGIMERNKSKVVDLNTKRTRIPILYVAAAACILAIISTIMFLPVRQNNHVAAPPLVQDKSGNLPIPGSNKAVLVLNDGSIVTLDSAGNGVISLQGAAKVSKQSGELIYALDGKAAKSETTLLYNTLKTPKGGQYQLVLADGTRVWMNAGSSLHFPTSFPGDQRVVELTGEAYFEVAKDARRTFSVRVNDFTVDVLGTHFNVMAYGNEPAAAITLLEGAVNVVKGDDKASLRPGQQARLQPGLSWRVIDHVNTEETVAWKNGYFQFDHTSLDVLMRQVERWYDVDVSYQGAVPGKQFTGKISRKSDISEVMKVLELSNVYSRSEGKKILILDKKEK